MAKLILKIQGFDVYFTAESEETSEREHFINECGWSESEFSEYKLQKNAWFCAHVEIKKAGIVLSDQYLGCCSYKSVKEFYTVYFDDAFKDMVAEGISEAINELPKKQRSISNELNILVNQLIRLQVEPAIEKEV